ncbi:hypothetical protein LC040_05500 [Bacillus tianshenii]|nr:hypothetical protein LC040_05500 [Bacillus tianshenii]
MAFFYSFFFTYVIRWAISFAFISDKREKLDSHTEATQNEIPSTEESGDKETEKKVSEKPEESFEPFAAQELTEEDAIKRTSEYVKSLIQDDES